MLWIIIAVLCLISVAALWRSLQSHSTLKMESVQQRNIAIAREKSLEIESAFEAGDLDATARDQAIQDLEISLADELATSTELQDQFRTPSKALNYIALALVPLLALGTYSLTSNYQTNPESASMQIDAQGEVAQIQALIKRVEERVESHPQDQEGLFILAQTYSSMGRFEASAQRWGQLIKLTEPSADLYTNYADNLAMANDRVFTKNTANILAKALSLEPNHISGLWLSGLAQQQLGNNEAALRHWLKLKPLLHDDPESSQELASLIDDVSQSLGARAVEIKTESATIKTAKQPTATTQITLTVKVSISSELQAETNPEDSVFVFARANAGPPMPLAAVKLAVSNLPTTVTLDDSMALMPQMMLSKFNQVLVGARISKTGQAISQSGDLESALVSTKNTNPETIEITISKRKP